MRRLCLLATSFILLLPAGSLSLRASIETPLFDIHQPTVLAFFRPTSHADESGSRANDTLSDFQVYLRKASAPLGQAGIEVHDVYARSFQVRERMKTTTFQTKKIGIGYYLVSPGKKPRVEYGLMSDSDLIRVASEYFDMRIK
jgi:hypothetical protein